MKRNKIKKAIRTGNRFGKTTMGMAANQPDEDCIESPKPRRSIPVAEVNAMLEREAKRHRHEPTLYDERTSTINAINETQAEEAHLLYRLRQTRFSLAEQRERLRQVNNQITDELYLDPVR